MSDEREVLTPEQALAKAKAQGYDPDRYEQSDPKWKSPEQFLDFGEQLTPVLKERTKYLETQNADLRASLQDIKKRVEEFAKLHEATKEEAYKQAIATLKAERKAAFEEGDFDKAEEITETIEETKTAQTTTTETKARPEAATAIPNEVVQTYDAWLAGHPWADERKPEYNEDMAAFAIAVGQNRIRKGAAHTGEDFKVHLTYVADKVKERFPEKFDAPRRSSSMVDAGSDSASSVPKGKHTYANLPKEHQQSCDLLVETGTFKSRDEYLAKYKWDKN